MKPQRTVAKYWFAHAFQLSWCLAGGFWCLLDLTGIVHPGDVPEFVIIMTYFIGLVFSVWLQIRWGNRVLWEPIVRYTLSLTVRVAARVFPDFT